MAVDLDIGHNYPAIQFEMEKSIHTGLPMFQSKCKLCEIPAIKYAWIPVVLDFKPADLLTWLRTVWVCMYKVCI